MIQIIAWIGAITGFLAAGIMLFGPVAPEKRQQTRRTGIIFLFVGAFNVLLATLVLR
jgi:NADH:ubiquinone oxidoreductase subunit 6 (subunit J)